MTDTTGLEWLQVGAKVAYIHGGYHHDAVTEATVEKIGKRDVVVTVSGRSEKFNITHTATYRGDEGTTWLRRRGTSTWDRGTELGPLDHPRVAAINARQERDNAVSEVRRWADEFQSRRDVATAKELRAAVDAFLKLHADQTE